MIVLDAAKLATLNAGFDLNPLLHLDTEYNPKLTAAIEQDARFTSISHMHRAPLYWQLFQLPARLDSGAFPLGFTFVDDRYFETIGVPIVQGRGFRKADLAPGSTAIVVSRNTARRLWPSANPIGQTIEVIEDSPTTRYRKGRYEVIGIAGDVTTGFLFQGRDASAVYFPTPPGDKRDKGIVVRAAVEPAKAARALEEICATVDPTRSCEARPLSDAAWMQTYPFTIGGGVTAGLGAIALLLTCVGLYGLIGYAVVQRTKEIGIRAALGATRRNILGLVLGQIGWRVATGVFIGLPAAVGAVLFAKTMVQMEAANQLLPFAGTPAVLLAVSMLAALLPARKATKIDPASALRHD